MRLRPSLRVIVSRPRRKQDAQWAFRPDLKLRVSRTTFSSTFLKGVGQRETRAAASRGELTNSYPGPTIRSVHVIGTLLAHYRIVEQIGAGGMGVVYRAHDEHLHRDVAIKVLPAGVFADEAERKRFRREALALAKLSHPNIATIHEFQNQDGLDFLVMEYVTGESLAETLQRGPFLCTEVLRLGAQVAGALEEAHRQGVIHRDLKPHNVRLTSRGDVKVLDFGIARLLHGRADDPATRTHTEEEVISGTMPYMSPEQLQGHASDPRTDIWALGVVLYELATGHTPFRGRTSAELATAILRDPPSSISSSVPAGFATVIQRCLSKDPSQRYQQASAVGAALEATGATIASGTAALLPARLRFSRQAIVIAAVALVLVVLIGGLAWRAGHAVSKSSGVTSPSPRIAAIAVLPLDNLTGDATQEYFVDGMTEALTLELSKISGLKVTSRTSAMKYKGMRKALGEITQELGVDAAVEGSVARSGNRVRVTAQLIHAQTEQHVWADQYERELSDILTLQSEVARAIAERIRVQLTPGERARLVQSRRVNPAAYDAYALGRFHLGKRNADSISRAVEQFKKAIAIDPDYAQAWAGLAGAYVDREIFGGSDFQRAAVEIRAAAERAMNLDDTLAEPHSVMSIIRFNYDWDWSAGESEHLRALELNPNSTDSNSAHAYYLQMLKRDSEALASVHRAVELDPLSAGRWSDEGRVVYRMRRYDDAIARYQRALELEPGFVVALSRLIDG
jgi:serine/threonine-protein kinase